MGVLRTLSAKSERLFALLTGADIDSVLDVVDKGAPVPRLSSVATFFYYRQDGFHFIIPTQNFDLGDGRILLRILSREMLFVRSPVGQSGKCIHSYHGHVFDADFLKATNDLFDKTDSDVRLYLFSSRH